MSFTPPTTYASTGQTGYLAQYLIGDAGSPPIMTAIAEVRSFSVKPIDVPDVDFTHLLSKQNTRELRPGMIKPGTASITGTLIADATQLNFATLAQAQTVFSSQVKAPMAGNTGTFLLTINGFVKSVEYGPFENDKPNEFKLEIQMEGGFTQVLS